MALHLRKQIREAVSAAGVLGNLTTTGARVYQSRTHELQDTDLPGLRIYTNDEDVQMASLGASRTNERDLDLVVECCAKESADLDDKLDLMLQEVEVAIAANQALGGLTKWIQLRKIEIDMEGEAEKEVGVARMTFGVRYYATLGAPDVAL